MAITFSGSGNPATIDGTDYGLTIVPMGSQVSTAGTSINFSTIPSWVRRITVVLQGVSTTGLSDLSVQLGTSAGTTITGYLSTTVQTNIASGDGGSSSTTGFIIRNAAAANVASVIMHIVKVTGNQWVSSHCGKLSTALTVFGGGDVTLSGACTSLRVTTEAGLATFDAGTINVLYE